MRRPWVFSLGLLAALLLGATAWRFIAIESMDAGASPAAPTGGSPVPLKIESLDESVQLSRGPDGSYVWIMTARDDSRRALTSEEFAAHVYERSAARDWLGAIFNVSSTFGLIWVGLGLLGQLLFTARMLVQWLASEKSRQSVVPPLFWWLSLVGATMLLAYFLWRRDVVGVLGQAFGWIVYVRNIHLIYVEKGRVRTGADPAPEPELAEPSLTGLRGAAANHP